jgi:2TM domain
MTDLGMKREAAIDRINAKRDFKIHAAVFAVANLVFVVGWLLTGPASYFWPIWPFLGWGPRAELPCVVRLRPQKADLRGRDRARDA